MTSLIAQAAAPATASPGGGYTQVIMLLLMMGGMYFLLIAPQQKKAKQQAALIAALKSGDEIVTSSGIYGVITNVKDDRFVVRIAENTKIEIDKASIARVTSQSDAEEKKSS
jgi:preprotein translocase subunit YajC